jgi:hypothetical protein
MVKKIILKSMVVITCLLLQFNLWGQTSLTVNVEKAGTLPTLINASQKYEITDLTLTGSLNGTDIKFIREMAGIGYGYTDGSMTISGRNEFRRTNGKLSALDLSGANIVSGGGSYMFWGGNTFYITSDNTISENMFEELPLTNLILPNSVTLIEQFALYNMSSLKSVTIGSNVTYIGYWSCRGWNSSVDI